MRTMTLTVDGHWQAALRQAGEQFKQAWKSGEYQGEFIGFASPALLFAALTPARWEIIDHLQKNQAPLDFGQAAKDFGRGLPELEADIRALLELGLLERQEDGKIVCPFGEIRAEFSLKRVA